ncbi:MAG: acyltransferase family protein [Casimicrobiaceae bacterium]
MSAKQMHASSERRPTKGLRRDIQALRGLAVLLVVAYHANRNVVAAGYLGVDMFFVISGYLITRLVDTGIESGSFSFQQFYFRRAKRLLPAAYVTFLVTAMAAPLFLETTEYRDFVSQLIGAVTFTCNIVLWQQAGYFGGAAELKPLLHVWSLSLEEQYYLFLPATLVFIPRRYWFPVTVLILLSSATLWYAGTQIKPIATFYLLPTRAWELAIGSLGALSPRSNVLHRFARPMFAPSIAALLFVPLMPLSEPSAMFTAPIVCLATLFVLLRDHPLLPATLPVRFLAPVGNFSYSLYLVHWPLFAFANNAWVGDIPGDIRFAGMLLVLVLSLALGYLLYRFVERPMHQADIHLSPRLLVKTLAASIGLMLVPVGLARATQSDVDYARIRRTNYGFGEACEYGSRFEVRNACRDSTHPSMLVWGDSFAMHLVPGILATAGTAGIEQATRSECGPLLGIAPAEQITNRGPNRLSRRFAESCIAFNQSVIAYLAHTASIDTVVLASPFRQYLEPSEFLDLEEADGRTAIFASNEAAALRGINRTISAVRALGKRAVVVAPPPSGGFDVGRCLERRAERRLAFGAPRNCEIPWGEYQRTRRRELDFLSRVSRYANVPVLGFDSILCDQQACKTELDGTFIYRDAVHLSYAGSRLLGERSSLATALLKLAR